MKHCLSILVLLLLAQSADAQQQLSTPKPQQSTSAGIQQQEARGVQPPAFLPLSEKHQQYIQRVLMYWQSHTEKIDHYRSNFERWQFDTVYGPRNTFKTFSTGKVRFANPDKGLFKVEKVLTYQPASAQSKASYKEVPGTHGEFWVCDGKSIFEYDFLNERLIQQVLPAELQGKNIINGPLPFLFGCNAQDIMNRFWVRAITPQNVEGEIWLEAYPKTIHDASNYQKVHIIIDNKDFLPKGMVIFDRSYEKGKNHSRTVFNFKEREINFATTLEKLNPFYRNFYEPALPSGWKKVVNAAPTAKPTRQANSPTPQPR
ncbi:MAG: TIGR03009 domain-containing protein [Planctomycetaceae bacterium]|nr:hypothetical protein [Planctomycetaceae bacterium]